MPTKFVSFPKYETFVADKRFAELAKALGLPASDNKEGVQSLIKAIKELMKEVNMPLTIAECGVDKKVFMSKVAELADRAFEDQCTTANPRLPLVKSLKASMSRPSKGDCAKSEGARRSRAFFVGQKPYLISCTSNIL